MNDIKRLKQEVKYELEDHILPFWINNIHGKEGEYIGRITANCQKDIEAPISLVMIARLLWTFSAAFKTLQREEYKDEAQKAKLYILQHFIDNKYGGAYWSVNNNGSVHDSKKQFYGIAFTIYALSEYSMAFNDSESLDIAIELYNSIMEHALDTQDNGYIEATNRDWSAITDQRLSDKDENEPKTMNTHLHILEAFSNLYKAWPSPNLYNSIVGLLKIFEDNIIQNNNHLGLFFDNNWNRKDNIISFGHDIEASWLLYESAIIIDNPAIIDNIKKRALDIASAAMNGVEPDGSMIYEQIGDNNFDRERHWWVQAETLVGEIYLWKIHNKKEYAEKSMSTWKFIKENLISPYGEWYWSILPNGNPNTAEDLAGFWKCPYHNSRACLKLIELL